LSFDINKTRSPSPEQVRGWGGHRFAAALRHDQTSEHYNPDFRQLLHVGYKVAAEMARSFTSPLKEYEDIIGQNVRDNIYERHIKPIFPGFLV